MNGKDFFNHVIVLSNLSANFKKEISLMKYYNRHLIEAKATFLQEIYWQMYNMQDKMLDKIMLDPTYTDDVATSTTLIKTIVKRTWDKLRECKLSTPQIDNTQILH